MKESDDLDISRQRVLLKKIRVCSSTTISPFKNHVASVTWKANRMLGIIRRTFDYLEEDTFITLNKS